MRKILFLIAAIATITLASCKKENPDTPSNPNDTTGQSEVSILGNWIMDCHQSTTNEDYVAVDPSESWSDYYTCYEMGLVNAGYNFSEETVVVTTTFSGEGTYHDTYSYTLVGSTLTLDEEEVYTVTTLDDKHLVLDGEGVSEDEDGRYSYQIHYVFNRE